MKNKCEKCGENVSVSKQCKESFSVEIDKDGNAHYFHLRCVFEEKQSEKELQDMEDNDQFN